LRSRLTDPLSLPTPLPFPLILTCQRLKDALPIFDSPTLAKGVASELDLHLVMVANSSSGTSRPYRSTPVRVAIWVLSVIALIELILAAIALAPRFVSGLRAGNTPLQTQSQVAASLLNTSTSNQTASQIPLSQPASQQSLVPLSQDQQAADSPAGNTSLKQVPPADKEELPPRQPPADAVANGEAPLQIVNARLSDSEDGSKKLQVAIKGNSREQIDSSQEKVQVYFYDQDGDEIVPSKAQVTSKWLNWESGAPQLVEVKYLPESVDPGVKFAGYVIAVYYKGDLQDCRSQPARLQKLFEPKYYIGTDE